MKKPMKPVEIYEADQAFKANKPVIILNKRNYELTILSHDMNPNVLTSIFSSGDFIFYVYE